MRHLGEARALAAEQIFHAGAAGRLAAAERVDPFAFGGRRVGAPTLADPDLCAGRRSRRHAGGRLFHRLT